MLEMSNVIVEDPTGLTGRHKKISQIAHVAELKMVDYLRLTQSKNQFNRLSAYHYLNIPVSQSTEPVRGIDYIHPVVTPGVDYATAVATKCLLPNGKLKFEFERFNENDVVQSEQATDMVSYMLNSKNDIYQIVRDWVQDACINKNGIVMVHPTRRPIVQYKEVEGTKDELKAFEILAAEKGLVAKRTSTKRIGINEEGVLAELSPELQELGAEGTASEFLSGGLEQAIGDVVAANTNYRVRYKLSGFETTVKVRHVAQHYFICNPTIPTIQEQDFVGFFDPMTIHQVKELFPMIDMEAFSEHAKYGPAGAYQAGALENDLALHARDSTPVPGQGVIASAGADKYSRVVTLSYAWIRQDVDNDGQEEIVEICWSGSYVIYCKEVEIIPLANICPKPIVGNFFGYSIAERLAPMQEYATSIARAEMSFAMQASTPRVGVNPEFIDAEEMQRGVSALFVLDRKFDPTKHVYEFAPMQGNLGYVQSSMERFERDKMAMIGMTSPSDVMNPEVMKDGNSGFKLQLAMGPNQLIQDEMVKNCAIGLRDLIYLVWKTMVQYSDDFNIQQLAASVTKGLPFLDAMSMENFEFIDRRMINIDLALGFKSEENEITRQKLIAATQAEFTVKIGEMAAQGYKTPELFMKARRPAEDALRCLGVKDVDAYLLTLEEAMSALQAKDQQGPNPEAQKLMAETELAKAKTQTEQAKAMEIHADVTGQSAGKQLEMVAARSDKLHGVEIG